MKGYHHLTLETRLKLETLLDTGQRPTAIARYLGLHRSTLWRERRRNAPRPLYDARLAQGLACDRRTRASSRTRIDGLRWTVVEDRLRQGWSPQQIAGTLRAIHGLAISHERIYQHVIDDHARGGSLYTHLTRQRRRHHRIGNLRRRHSIPDRRPIDQRPTCVADRSRLGDWEADTIVGARQQGYLVSLTERRSRLVLLGRVADRCADTVARMMVRLLRPVRDRVLTITSDNGTEFAHHQTVARALKADFFFAHPYSAWERGTNENANGLVRRHFPKGTNFLNVSDAEVRHVMNRLNDRPRRILGYRTPAEVFFAPSG